MPKMPRHRLLALLAGATLLVASAPRDASAQEFKIGIVDMKRVFADYYKTKEAETKVNEGKSIAKKELDERNAKYKQLIQEWQDLQTLIKDPALSETLREAKTKEAQDKAAEAKSLEREMAEFRQRRERQLQEEVIRMRKAILEEIRELVEGKAKQDNYDLVFDKSGLGMNGVPFLLHSKDAVDFSNEIIAELNKDAPAPAPAPASAPAPTSGN
jgi:outer membrane protein